MKGATCTPLTHTYYKRNCSIMLFELLDFTYKWCPCHGRMLYKDIHLIYKPPPPFKTKTERRQLLYSNNKEHREYECAYWESKHLPIIKRCQYVCKYCQYSERSIARPEFWFYNEKFINYIAKQTPKNGRQYVIDYMEWVCGMTGEYGPSDYERGRANIYYANLLIGGYMLFDKYNFDKLDF